MQESFQVAALKNDFYRDGFRKMVGIVILLLLALFMLGGLSLSIYLSKPKPIIFQMQADWRVQGDMPLTQPYVSTPQLLQWVSDTLQKAFDLDFVNYNEQLQAKTHYFTTNGWGNFLNQLNIYANYNNVQTDRLFVTGAPAGAPFVLRKGLLLGRYAWWVQMPFTLTYAGSKPSQPVTLTLQILVVRVPTLNNLGGIGIDNVIVVQNSGYKTNR